MAGIAADRKPLLDKLRAYRPSDAHEARMAEQLRRFVEAHADCFERSLAIGHVTGSAWIVDRDRTHALVTHHRKLEKWLQLGGHADGDSDILRVALREAREESSLQAIRPVSEQIFDVDIHAMAPARGSEPAAHFHYDVRFLFEADREAALAVSEESRSLAWVPLDQVAELNGEESVLRMVRKTVGKAKVPGFHLMRGARATRPRLPKITAIAGPEKGQEFLSIPFRGVITGMDSWGMLPESLNRLIIRCAAMRRLFSP